eukprot:4755362-Prymnesium_polylepis.1
MRRSSRRGGACCVRNTLASEQHYRAYIAPPIHVSKRSIMLGSCAAVASSTPPLAVPLASAA